MTRYELRWDFRKAWFYLALALTVLTLIVFGIVVPYATRGTGGGTSATPTTGTSGLVNGTVTSSWWLLPPFFGMASIVPAFIPLLFGSMSSSESFARERDKGTLSALLVQPLRRSEVVLGKFAAKAVEFLLLSTILIGGMLVASTVFFGPQEFLDGVPLMIGAIALDFLFFAAFALMISSVLRRPAPVTVLALFIWGFSLYGLYQLAGRPSLLPLGYYVPFWNAMLVIPGTMSFLVAGGAPVTVSLYLALYNLTIGPGTGTSWFLNASLGLVLGTALCLVLAWRGLSSVEVQGE